MQGVGHCIAMTPFTLEVAAHLSYFVTHAVTDIFESRESEVVSTHPLFLQHDIVQRGVRAFFLH